MKVIVSIGIVVTLLLATGCAFKSVSRHKNIVYRPADSTRHVAQQQLNVFAPRRHAEAKKVLIYLHGGSWRSGRRGLYNFLGNRFARKNIVMVVVGYPLSPEADYTDMLRAAAMAMKWTKTHIREYGGDPDQVFLSGHSAGGHLAALLAVNNDYFRQAGLTDPLKGVILIDAAGIDMYNYLRQEKLPQDHSYYTTFTHDPAQWKAASPIYQVNRDVPPMLIYVGERTYPFIRKPNEKMAAALQAAGVKTTFKVVKRRKHVPMITQFFNTANHRYKEIRLFMEGKQEEISVK